MTKICDFLYPFYDQNLWFSLPYLWPIYDLTKSSLPYLWPDTLVVNKMAAKWLKSIPYLWPKRLKNHTLWGRKYLYSPYEGLPPPGGPLPTSCMASQMYNSVKQLHVWFGIKSSPVNILKFRSTAWKLGNFPFRSLSCLNIAGYWTVACNLSANDSETQIP